MPREQFKKENTKHTPEQHENIGMLLQVFWFTVIYREHVFKWDRVAM